MPLAIGMIEPLQEVSKRKSEEVEVQVRTLSSLPNDLRFPNMIRVQASISGKGSQANKRCSNFSPGANTKPTPSTSEALLLATILPLVRSDSVGVNSRRWHLSPTISQQKSAEVGDYLQLFHHLELQEGQGLARGPGPGD